MLQLKNIKKDYTGTHLTVNALKGVSLNFRKNEFVSILGQSGCGKTTLLNIIGGLDKYTEGDIIIDGVSTKDFNDRDWDAYRNHSIGFVFQSYNLIPHQTVLQNVELALTLSGVSKHERRKRAKEALTAVGLADQFKKKPSEMSGGQMQRVAIARAIVNDPDIILADEPTGALDTETSISVMEILKEISKERLVIMVTHNPELAEQYSTRIVRMLDGKITDDSNPPNEENEITDNSEKNIKVKKSKKPSMSFSTSFGLSFKNLISKKGRTALTSFAGSIGIIGIALIYAVSNGATTFINSVQEETLSSYPLTLEAQHMDLATLMETFMDNSADEVDHQMDAVYQKPALFEMVNAFSQIKTNQNDLKSFKLYLEDKMSDQIKGEKINNAIAGVQYGYNFDMLIYTENIDGKIIKSDTEELFSKLMVKFFRGGNDEENNSNQSTTASNNFFSMMGTSSAYSTGLWQQILPGDNGNPVNDMLYNQYDLVYGTWPTQYNEIILVVDKNNEIDDMTLFALGLKSQEDIDKIADAAINKTELQYETSKWSFEDICKMEFRTVLNSKCYIYDETSGTYTDLRNTDAGLKYLYDNGIPLKVSGIIRPKEDSISQMLTGSIAYTHLLTEHIIEEGKDRPVIKAQLDSPSTDIFTGLPFKENSNNLSNEEKTSAFKGYIKEFTDREKASYYIKIASVMPKDSLDKQVSGIMASMTREKMEATLSQALSEQMGMSKQEIDEYISEMTDEEINKLFSQMITEQVKMQYAETAVKQLISLPSSQLVYLFNNTVKKWTDEDYAFYYDEVLEFSSSSYEDNLIELGYIDIDNPDIINLYASSFENKDIIEEIIAEYNNGVEELSKITYTDYVGIMMSSVTTIINAITYVLIAFVAVSLIVSSIMIAVITLISVQERTKEIGILRAMGASKANVSSMFNMETLIIGLTSGLLGVGITYLLCLPINAILHNITGIYNLSAVLPIRVALLLVLISVVLNMISGIIPSRSAAKKDPVVALRTE